MLLFIPGFQLENNLSKQVYNIIIDFFIFSTYLFTFNYNHIENYNRVNKCNNRFKFAFSLSNVLKLFVWHLNNY